MKRFKKMMAIAIVAVMTMMYAVPMSFALDEGTDYNAPTGKTLTYTGADQALITAGFVSDSDNYTMQYKLSNEEDDAWSTTLPKGKSIGSYTVNWRIVDSSPTAVNSGNVTATIAAGAGGVTDTHTISLSDSDTHTYKIFQVLTGTLSEQGSLQLGNPAWGADAIASPGDVNAFIESITADGLSEADIAALVAAKVDLTGDGQGTITKDTPKTGLVTGYYILVDVTADLEEGETKALHVVKVVNDIEDLTIKYDTVSDEKEIVSDTLGQDEDEVNDINGSKDNVSVGDTVNFKITATIPEKATDYNYFYFIINDTLDPGLTFTEGSIKVYKDSISNENLLVKGEAKDYIEKTGSDAGDYTFQIGMVDAKSLAGKDIIVTYSAVLNKDAELGDTANKNTSTVTYSNDPNHTYDGDNNPGFPSSQDEDVMGETPDSITETYTTGIEIQKVDENGKPLTGVKFKIQGDSTKTVVSVTETFTKDADGDYYKLTNGKYTKTAPTEQSMKAAAAGATEGYVVKEDGDEGDVTTVGGVDYIVYVPAEHSGRAVYTLVNSTLDQYEQEEGSPTKYKKTKTTTANNVKTNHELELAVDANGRVNFDGLGAGTYTITETDLPSGYNTIEPFTVTIGFDGTADGTTTSKWTFTPANGSPTGVYDMGDGVYKYEIQNNKGTELPQTGGIGTTLFYLIGACLVIGAGVVLVTRRRVNSEE